MNKNKGFTLIELLVVIAIIGILASVVLASLSSARDKSKDAAVKSQLSSIRAQAELYNTKVGNYLGLCEAAVADSGLGGAAGPGLLKAILDSEGVVNSSVVTAIATAGVYNVITCHVNADGLSWAVEAPLIGTTEVTPKMHCIDSTGSSSEVATLLEGDDTICQ
ncbi:MAG: type II secretion system protein [Candidatus Paceibacterota bacterium]